MKEIIFRHNILQKDGRVKIPSPIVDSLNIKEEGVHHHPEK